MSGFVSYDPSLGVFEIGDMWVIQRRGHRARCLIATHPLGWELRVMQGANLMRSQVCKSQTEVFDAADDWKHEHTKNGWDVVT